MSKFNYFRHSEVEKNVDFDRQHLQSADPADIEVLLRLYYSLEFAVGQVFADGDESYYPNASFSVLSFLTGLRLIQQVVGAGARFLDVGCGLGSKVWLAHSLGFDAYGLEINPKYATIAGEHVGVPRVHCQDAISFPDYSHYDVIYFYNPMPTGELENAILANAKKGAIIFHAIKLLGQPKRKHVRLAPGVMRLTDRGPTDSRGGNAGSPPQSILSKSHLPIVVKSSEIETQN